MPNAKDDAVAIPERKILAVGAVGAGKSTLFATLPGRKFAYAFDPNAKLAYRGYDIEYEEFLPQTGELDTLIKSFNKNAKLSDRPTGRLPEPTVYNRWVADWNKRVTDKFFQPGDWIGFDSVTSLVNAIMDRQLWINNRSGESEDQADAKLVGITLTNIFRQVAAEKCNLYVTAHTQEFQDDKTKRITTSLYSPGRSRRQIPMLFTDIIELVTADEAGKRGRWIVTQAGARGFQDIRTSFQGLTPLVDVTIADRANPTRYGLGKLLADEAKKIVVPPIKPVTADA